MDDKCHIDMLGLMILFSLLTGTSGLTYLHMFRSDGDNVSLPCKNALTGCTSTTWLYNRESSSRAVELFEKGIKRNDTERRERLSLGSGCSLNIYKATTEDHGHYGCRKHYAQIYTDDIVFLHVLHVSPSSTQTGIKPGRSFSLSCQLYVYDGYGCVDLFNNEGVELVWKNKMDVNLQSDSRYQISFSPEHCNSSLTTTLLNEDDNTEWRCEITKGDQVKTSVRYTVTYSVNPAVNPAVTPAVTAAVTAAVAALLALLALWFICKRRADKAAIVSLTPVTPPAADVHENTDDVAYAEVITSRNKHTERHNVQSDDEVTYSVIR